MVAVLAVLAYALAGWPRGGFVGVDIFFVVAGYLVTESLLRTTAESGTVRVGRFYLERLQRIVPAATFVLILTFAASTVVLASDVHSVGIDAVFAAVVNGHPPATTSPGRFRRRRPVFVDQGREVGARQQVGIVNDEEGPVGRDGLDEAGPAKRR